MKNRIESKGFTLIEILVAMAIFTLIGLASTGLLTSVIQSDELSEQRFDQLQILQRAMLTIERDILQAVPRPIRVQGESTSIVISGQEGLFNSEFGGLGLVRDGWHNPQMLLHRSTLQAVGYRISEGRLERLYGNYVDNVVGYEPKVKILLEDVEDFQVRFFVDEEEDPTDPENWEKTYVGSALPRAVALIITTKQFGEIRREFLLGGVQ
jgi:general secretion pathway protein J